MWIPAAHSYPVALSLSTSSTGTTLTTHTRRMASAGGLTRRRGAGQAAIDGDENASSRVASPVPKSTPSYNDRSPETSYSSDENGHKIAFDPRDISESEERSKQPKLTLMEEILLLGLKDKQVRF